METEFDYPSEEKRNIDHLKLPESVNNAVNGLPFQVHLEAYSTMPMSTLPIYSVYSTR